MNILIDQILLCQLQPRHEVLVRTLFTKIDADPASRYFHPHSFSADEAARICGYAGKDLYLLMIADEQPIGYGMLRGWEAGYEVPSLGIFIAAEARRTGVARLLMEYLHYCARLRGARAVLLKVYEANVNAARLYKKLGYIFASEPKNGQLVGKLEL